MSLPDRYRGIEVVGESLTGDIMEQLTLQLDYRHVEGSWQMPTIKVVSVRTGEVFGELHGVQGFSADTQYGVASEVEVRMIGADVRINGRKLA